MRHMMGTLLATWEGVLHSNSEEFAENTPGKLFKMQIIPKINYNLKPIRP